MIVRFQPVNAASRRVSEKVGMRFERNTTGRSGEALSIYALEREGWLRLQSDS